MLTNIRHLVLLNGPPSSGKDTIAENALKMFPMTGMEKYSAPLKTGGSAALGIPLEELDADKETVIPSLGVSWRQYQIDMSEYWYKPLYGEDIFGRLMVERLARGGLFRHMFISDCGFSIEVPPVLDAMPEGSVICIRLHRDGCDYDNDSRNYLPTFPGVPTFDVDNNGDVGELLTRVGRIVLETAP